MYPSKSKIYQKIRANSYQLYGLVICGIPEKKILIMALAMQQALRIKKSERASNLLVLA